MVIDQLQTSINKLEYFLNKNGWAGYDPYDILGTDLFLRFQQLPSHPSFFERGVNKLLFGFERRWPLAARQILGVKPQVNAKAMGLFARGYLSLFESTGEENYKQKALDCLNWLRENSSDFYSKWSWGYPFDWQSKVFIPKDTPSSVVSCIVGDSFWWAYKILGDKEYLRICEGVCKFLMEKLNIDEMSKDSICFSYTPMDNFHIHNANLLAAEFLIRVGQETNQLQWINNGLRAGNYTLSEQNENGSIYYWGRDQNNYNPNHIDHYHSGFEMRALYRIWKLTGEECYHQSVSRYYQYYINNLIYKLKNLIIPKMSPNNLYPINIHSCAEAILINSKFLNEFDEAKQILDKVSQWTIENMQVEEGWFIYKIDKLSGRENRISIPYIRWGQAWMLKALAQLLSLQ
jgi:rhamnogalacturonyl hydrolase YesR